MFRFRLTLSHFLGTPFGLVLFSLLFCFNDVYAYTIYDYAYTIDITVGRSKTLSWSHYGVKCNVVVNGFGTEQIAVTPTGSGAIVKAIAKTSGVPLVHIGYVYSGSGGSIGNQYLYHCNINVIELGGVTIPSTLNLTVGDEYDYNPVLNPSNAETDFTWYSSNTNVAEVVDGHLVAKGVGVAQIQCVTHNGKSCICNLTVSDKKIEGLTMPDNPMIITVGQKEKLVYETEPSEVSGFLIDWTTNNPSVVQVTPMGEIIGIASGTAIVTAKTNDGSRLTAYRIVNVEDNSPETKTTLTVKGGVTHSLIHYYKEDEQAKIDLVPEEGWELYTLTFNGEDVTDDVVDNTYITPALSGANSLDVVMKSKSSTTDIDEVQDVHRRISLRTTGNRVEVLNLDQNEMISIYNVEGACEYQGPNHTVTLNPNRVYILRTEKEILKFAL